MTNHIPTGALAEAAVAALVEARVLWAFPVSAPDGAGTEYGGMI